MTRLKQKLLLMTFFAALVLLPQCVMAEYYVVISNPVNFAVTYSINGKSIQLPTGKQHRFTSQSDKFYLKYDKDASSETIWQKWSLNPNSHLRFQLSGRQLGLRQIRQDPVPPKPRGPVKASKNEKVQSSGYADTDVVMYTNGLLQISTYTKNKHWTEGLRVRLFVVCVDDRGRAIWVTKPNKCRTRGGKGDWFTPSRGTDTFTHNVPFAVAKIVHHLDIYHSTRGSRSIKNAARTWVKGINEVAKAADDLSPEAKQAMLMLAI